MHNCALQTACHIVTGACLSLPPATSTPRLTSTPSIIASITPCVVCVTTRQFTHDTQAQPYYASVFHKCSATITRGLLSPGGIAIRRVCWLFVRSLVMAVLRIFFNRGKNFSSPSLLISFLCLALLSQASRFSSPLHHSHSSSSPCPKSPSSLSLPFLLSFVQSSPFSHSLYAPPLPFPGAPHS